VVNSSIHEVTSTEQEIYLNYPQGDEIIHDPKIGFENLLLSSGVQPFINPLSSENLPIVVGVVAIAVLSVIVITKRK
jgi:hypothetical protein